MNDERERERESVSEERDERRAKRREIGRWRVSLEEFQRRPSREENEEEEEEGEEDDDDGAEGAGGSKLPARKRVSARKVCAAAPFVWRHGAPQPTPAHTYRAVAVSSRVPSAGGVRVTP